MSKKVVLLGDLGTDHQGFPPTPVIAGSPDVLIDGKPVARVGDPLSPHSNQSTLLILVLLLRVLQRY